MYLPSVSVSSLSEMNHARNREIGVGITGGWNSNQKNVNSGTRKLAVYDKRIVIVVLHQCRHNAKQIDKTFKLLSANDQFIFLDS